MFKGQFCYRITRVFKVHRLGQSRTIILFYYLFNHENGSIKMVFFLDVLYLYSLARWLPMWMSVMYVNWIALVSLKCPTHGMSPLCYLSYLSEWWEVDRTHVIACKILVEANGSTTITRSTSCLHTRFPGNHLPTSSTGWTRPTAT